MTTANNHDHGGGRYEPLLSQANSQALDEAIQDVGEADFLHLAAKQASEHAREGLPLRAQIAVVGYLARRPEGTD